MNALEIHNEAMQAAKDAAIKYVKEKGEPAFCGFAWVKIVECNKSPNKQFIKELSKTERRPGWNIAEKSYEGGYRISCPSYDIDECGWKYKQSMDIKEAACDAYASVLKNYGISAFMQSRAD